MKNSRREFIRKTSIASLGFWGLSQCALSGCKINMAPNVGFGPLLHREGEILSLPEGFAAKVISKKGIMMNDGLYVPGCPDGMGIFNWKNGKILLIRNHELPPGSYKEGPFGENRQLINKIERGKFMIIQKEGIICVLVAPPPLFTMSKVNK